MCGEEDSVGPPADHWNPKALAWLIVGFVPDTFQAEQLTPCTLVPRTLFFGLERTPLAGNWEWL